MLTQETEGICALIDHKALFYLKVQEFLLQRQAFWMETLQRYPIYIEQKSRTELKFSDSLLRLVIRRSIHTNKFDPEWPILIMHNKEKGFPLDITEATKAMMIKNKDNFVNIFGSLHLKLANNNTAARVQVLQQVDTILRYY